MEAYPTEYKTKSAAGQMQGSPNAFPILSWGSPFPFIAVGYAVLENATIPIVGEGNAEPNDTYVEQLVRAPRRPSTKARASEWSTAIASPSWDIPTARS